MDTDLVVVVPFNGYAAGTPITDPVAIAAIVGTPLAAYVVRVAKGTGASPPAPPPALSPASLFQANVAGVALPFTLAELAAALAALGTTLGALVLSPLVAVAGTPFSATVTGLSPASTLAASSSDGTALTIATANGVTTIAGTFATPGTPSLTLIEVLAGATGSPRTSTFAIAVAVANGRGAGSTNLDLSQPLGTDNLPVL